MLSASAADRLSLAAQTRFIDLNPICKGFDLVRRFIQQLPKHQQSSSTISSNFLGSIMGAFIGKGNAGMETGRRPRPRPHRAGCGRLTANPFKMAARLSSWLVSACLTAPQEQRIPPPCCRGSDHATAAVGSPYPRWLVGQPTRVKGCRDNAWLSPFSLC